MSKPTPAGIDGPAEAGVTPKTIIEKAARGATDAIFLAIVEDEKLAAKFNCGEIEALADLYRAQGQPKAASSIIASHASGDAAGDAHFTG